MSVASAQTAKHSSSGEEPSSSSSSSQRQPPQRRNRYITSVACYECRKRKIKCDGTKPTCSQCCSRDLSCAYEADPEATRLVNLQRKYDQLRERVQDMTQALEMLVLRPEDEAMSVLQCIRSNDLSSALSMIANGELMQPQQSSVAEGITLPPVRSDNVDAPFRQFREPQSVLPPLAEVIHDPLSAFEGSESYRGGGTRSDPKLYQIGHHNKSKG